MGGEGGEAGGGGEAGQELPLHRLQEERGEEGAEVETHPEEMSVFDDYKTSGGIRIYSVIMANANRFSPYGKYKYIQ